MYNEMYNETNILTMTDEEIKNSTLTIADKFGVKVRRIFVSRDDDGDLVVVLYKCDVNDRRSFDSLLWKYMSGIVDINGNVVGSDEIECPAVMVKDIDDESDFNEFVEECSSIEGYYQLF